MNDEFYIEEVSTQGGGYARCVICSGVNYSSPDGEVEHVPACTPEFRQTVAKTVGYV